MPVPCREGEKPSGQVPSLDETQPLPSGVPAGQKVWQSQKQVFGAPAPTGLDSKQQSASGAGEGHGAGVGVGVGVGVGTEGSHGAGPSQTLQ